MKHLVATLLLVFAAAVCVAAEPGNSKPATESSAMSEARAIVDHDLAVVKRVASSKEVKTDGKGFKEAMSKAMVEEFGNNIDAERNRRESIVAKLSKPELAELVEYAKKKDAELNNRMEIAALNDPAQLQQWCDFYHGRAQTDFSCTVAVEMCWDVCVLPDGHSRKYWQSPYVCGVCTIWPF